MDEGIWGNFSSGHKLVIRPPTSSISQGRSRDMSGSSRRQCMVTGEHAPGFS